ncbi:MAG: LPS export ABC transporter periplasmic protein LptC [Cellulophaga sp.]
MKEKFINKLKSIAVVATTAMLFFSCKDTYKGEGEEAQMLVYPQGIAKNFTLTYTELEKPMESEEISSSRVIAILSSPVREDYENLKFPYQTFPEGVVIEFFDKDGNKSTISADYGIIYSATNLIDLQGNVVVETHDGKKLEAPQLYYDREFEWIFTQENFTFTDPEDDSVLDGEGMDFNKNMNFLKAHKTYGIMIINNEE